MTMYQLTTNTTILRVQDGAGIPADPSNSDYAAYLIWLEQGNTPAPYTPPPVDRKAEIIASLADIDRRRIRPLAEGDAAFLAALNAQAIALRAELAGL